MKTQILNERTRNIYTHIQILRKKSFNDKHNINNAYLWLVGLEVIFCLFIDFFYYATMNLKIVEFQKNYQVSTI